VPQEAETGFHDPAFMPPLRTFYTVPSNFDFTDDRCARGRQWFICWPTTAPSSLDLRGDALLMPSLKDGSVYRIPLGADGTTLGEPVALWRSVNRYRDTAVSDDERAVYVATDSVGLTRDRSGAPTPVLENPGAILEFRDA
jgi:hypothetical protein